MAQEIINYGASANDGTGDPLRDAFIKVDNNFDQIWSAGPVGSNITILNNTISVTNTNGNLVLNPNSVGIIETRNHVKPWAGNINDLGDSTLRYRSGYFGVGGVDIVGNLTLKGPQNLKIPGGSPTYVLTTNGNGNLSWAAQALSGDIAAETFVGDGSTVDYFLTANSTTGGTIVAINGVQQIPVSAYSVTDDILTFTEAPPAGYFIDVRLLVLTNGFTGGTPGGSDSQVQYNNNGYFGGAAGFTFNDVSNVLIVPGDVIPSGNNTQSLGNATSQWNDLYLSNATIYMNSVPIGLTSGNVLTVNSQPVLTNNSSTTVTTTGNITANYFIGNGSQLTGLPVPTVTQDITSTGAMSIMTYDGALKYVSYATVEPSSGNIAGGNISAIGNISGNYLFGNGSQLTGISGVSTGSIGFTGNIMYDLSGMFIENSDLSHGATASLILPRNGGSAIPIQLTNSYGNITLQVGANSDMTSSWQFNNDGYLNFSGGGIKQTLNEDIYIRASDDENDGWSVYNVVDDGAGNILSQTRLEFDQYTIRTDAQGASYTWAFRDTGVLELPGDIYGNVGDNLTIKIGDQAGSDTFIDLQTRSYVGDALISNIRIANPDVTVSTANAAHNWTFDNAGNLTVPGNIQSISTGFPFSSGIIGIDNTSPAVITVADSVFPDVVTGRVTISGVNPPVQANGTWYYESVETNQFALYLDAGLTQPVDATGWPGYVDGGSAVSPGYSNLAITAGNVSIVSQYGETWTFEAGGALRIPNDITSIGTMDLDNRASGNTADIRLFAADDIQLQGRDRPNDLESEGGDINIYGGIGAAAVTGGFDTGGGGDIQIFGGIGGAGEATGTLGSSGGFVTIRGGDGGMSVDSAVGSGGTVNITAGSAPSAANTSLGGFGGVVNISAGDTTRIDENGGTITLTTGSASGDGTGVAGYVEINIPSSNVGPGGSWTFGGTGQILNVPANAEIYGANAGNLTVGCAGNTIVTSSDYGANVQNWVFGYTGNLTVPGNTVVSTANATGNVDGKSINIQAGAADQTDYYATAGGNLNLIGGLGASNDGGGGGPGGSVNITSGASADVAGHAGNVTINAGSNTWTFDYNGVATLPGEGILRSIDDTITLTSLNTSTGNANSVYLGSSGGLGFSDQEAGGNWLEIFRNGAEPQITVPVGRGNLYIQTSQGETPYNWTFDNTGNLTVPGNIVMPPGSTLVGNGASPAPSISGFSNGEFGGNVSVTGNISGGNISISTGGNISGNTAGYAIGYRDIPQVSFTGNATIATTDAGKHYYSTLSTGNVLTIANNASQGFQIGTAISIVNQGTGNITVAQGSGVTLYMAGNATSGNRSVATFGMATIMKVATDTWFINGTGVS